MGDMSVVVAALALCMSACAHAHSVEAPVWPYQAVELQMINLGNASAPAQRMAVPVPMPQVDETAVPTAPGSSRIVNGQEAERCQFPHQVAMVSNNGEFCGGSIIGSNWVLTAAHCVISASTLTVYAGSVEWRQAPHVVRARSFYYHGGYIPASLTNDIALVKLQQDLPLGDCVKVVELETTGCGTSVLDEVDAVVSGWGLTGDTATSVESKLRYVSTKTITNYFCEHHYNSVIVRPSTLCSLPVVAGSGGVICNGDSGGPLLLQETGRQIGINSFVSSLGCESGLPSGYARVPCFIDWINYVKTL